jgi:hypothetical protein
MKRKIKFLPKILQSIFILFAFIFSTYAFSYTKIKIERLDNFSSDQKSRIEKIVDRTEKIINSERFKNEIINYSQNGKKSFENNDGLSNEDVFKKIMAGAEQLQPEENNEWNLHLQLRFRFWIFSSVTAYTTSSTKIITIYSNYFSRASDSDLAGTICHEYTHKLGFTHDVKATKTRPYSVPYAVGDICSLLYVNEESTINSSK